MDLFYYTCITVFLILLEQSLLLIWQAHLVENYAVVYHWIKL